MTRSPTSDARASLSSAISNTAGEQEFYLASACDKVFLMPTASLDLTGMASYELFLRGTLDKIGAYPGHAAHRRIQDRVQHVHRAHLHARRTARWRESLNRDMYDQLIRGLADGRRKSEKDLRALIDHGPFLPEDAVRAGLVDDVAYEDEIDDKVKLAKGKVNFLTEADYRRVVADVARAQSRPAHRHHLCDRRDRLGREQLRLAVGAGRRLRDDDRLAAQGARGSIDQGHRPAHRQPRRLGDRVRRHLARGDADARREAAGRLDVRRRRVRRLLHRDARPRDRGGARDADRIRSAWSC